MYIPPTICVKKEDPVWKGSSFEEIILEQVILCQQSAIAAYMAAIC